MVTSLLEKSLAVQKVSGMVPGHQLYGTWVYLPVREALAAVGLDKIGVYIACLHNMVAQYITTRPII